MKITEFVTPTEILILALNEAIFNCEGDFNRRDEKQEFEDLKEGLISGEYKFIC